MGVWGILRQHRDQFWTAAVTKHCQEQRAAHHIERQGFPFYLPYIVDGTRRTLMFPGYIFVQVMDGWRSLVSTKGIARVFLVDGETPARVRSEDIARLRALEDNRGLVVLPDKFSPGERVRVSEGGFAGKAGVFKGMSAAHRCLVLLSFLGKSVVGEFDEDSLVAA